MRLFKKWQMLGKNEILTAAHCKVREDRNLILTTQMLLFQQPLQKLLRGHFHSLILNNQGIDDILNITT